MILLDTNLLTRMTRSHEPQASVARAAIQTLLGRGELLVLVPQNLYEFCSLPVTILDPASP
jgi:predicted nucleic acid-binding protein